MANGLNPNFSRYLTDQANLDVRPSGMEDPAGQVAFIATRFLHGAREAKAQKYLESLRKQEVIQGALANAISSVNSSPLPDNQKMALSNRLNQALLGMVAGDKDTSTKATGNPMTDALKGFATNMLGGNVPKFNKQEDFDAVMGTVGEALNEVSQFTAQLPQAQSQNRFNIAKRYEALQKERGGPIVNFQDLYADPEMAQHFQEATRLGMNPEQLINVPKNMDQYKLQVVSSGPPEAWATNEQGVIPVSPQAKQLGEMSPTSGRYIDPSTNQPFTGFTFRSLGGNTGIYDPARGAVVPNAQKLSLTTPGNKIQTSTSAWGDTLPSEVQTDMNGAPINRSGSVKYHPVTGASGEIVGYAPSNQQQWKAVSGRVTLPGKSGQWIMIQSNDGSRTKYVSAPDSMVWKTARDPNDPTKTYQVPLPRYSKGSGESFMTINGKEVKSSVEEDSSIDWSPALAAQPTAAPPSAAPAKPAKQKAPTNRAAEKFQGSTPYDQAATEPPSWKPPRGGIDFGGAPQKLDPKVKQMLSSADVSLKKLYELKGQLEQFKHVNTIDSLLDSKLNAFLYTAGLNPGGELANNLTNNLNIETILGAQPLQTAAGSRALGFFNELKKHLPVPGLTPAALYERVNAIINYTTQARDSVMGITPLVIGRGGKITSPSGEAYKPTAPPVSATPPGRKWEKLK